MKVIFLVCLTLLVCGTSARSHFHPKAAAVHHHQLKDEKPKEKHDARTQEGHPAVKQTPGVDKGVNSDVENAGAERIYREDEGERLEKEEELRRFRAHVGRPETSRTTGIDWVDRAQDELANSLNVWPKWLKAKNVIFMIGDGMGVSTVTAARIFKAHRQGKSTTEGQFSWETFPFTGLSKTYNTDQQTGDSAGSGTALLCGEKTRDNVICVNENVPEGMCDLVQGNELKSLLHRSMDAGKWGGVVTTTRITHATPACAYGVSPMRYWESDADVPVEHREKCWDHARQLVEKNETRRIRVILGGGRRSFIPNTMFDNEYETYRGEREDGRDLRQEWLDIKAGSGLLDTQYKYVENTTDFDNVDVNTVEYLLGLFEPSHMKYEVDREEETGNTWTEPTIAQMTKKSLDMLKKSSDGYFLLVEGGRIDLAHHDNNAYRALRDVIAFDDAVQVALDETNENDTLIVVTADHSHPFFMAGYATLDNDILGIVIDKYNETYLAEDNKPYLTLGYGNGPGWQHHRSSDFSFNNGTVRKDLTGVDTSGKDFRQDAGVPRSFASHGGEEVAIYARGPMSHLFSGTHEQHYIPHAAGYASCVGWNTDFCDSNPPPPGQ